MSANKPDFRAIEIDALDTKLAETARRKRIPSLTLDGSTPKDTTRKVDAQLKDGTADRSSAATLVPEPTHRPETREGLDEVRRAVRRRPLSLEVPDYLARELKVKAATEGVTVRFLVLSALVAQGYRIEASELEEDGRRLR